MSRFDGHGDPLQNGIVGWDDKSDGLHQMSGPAVGIVLSVHHADDKNNLMFQLLSGDVDSPTKGYQLEARVLMIFNGVECFVDLPHCVILPNGKTSNLGPGEHEPADYTEDVPNGCTADELDYYASGAEFGIENLSGDWVLLQFIGGQLQIPVITNWFQNPKNKGDSASVDDGKRFRLRRNNSELQIDKNGDWFFNHRVGQYIQMNGERITIKHIKGQTIHLDEDGAVTIVDGHGNTITSDEDGVCINNGESLVDVHLDGVRVSAPTGKFNVTADQINMIASRINATSGNAAKSLLHEDIMQQLVNMSAYLGTVNEVLGVVAAAVNVQHPGAVIPTDLAKIVANAALINTLNGNLSGDAADSRYRTKTLSGE